MLALLHILTIKSESFASNYIKLFSSEKIQAIKPKIDNQNITSCNLLLVGIQQYGFVYLNKSYQNINLVPRLLPSQAPKLRKDPGWGWSRDTPESGVRPYSVARYRSVPLPGFGHYFETR